MLKSSLALRVVPQWQSSRGATATHPPCVLEQSYTLHQSVFSGSTEQHQGLHLQSFI